MGKSVTLQCLRHSADRLVGCPEGVCTGNTGIGVNKLPHFGGRVHEDLGVHGWALHNVFSEAEVDEAKVLPANNAGWRAEGLFGSLRHADGGEAVA